MHQIKSHISHFVYKFSDILLLIAGIGIPYLLLLGARALGIPDESRYAEIPREMINLGNYIIPHLNHVIYFEKPPLYYWMVAGSFKMLGYSEWSARFPTALMGFLGVLMTYFAGARLYNRQVGLSAGLILGSALLYYAMAHLNTLDMTVSVLLSGALFSFIFATKTEDGPIRQGWVYSMTLFTALAVMAKGLIGIVFPGLIGLIWLGMTRHWQILKRFYILSALSLFLAITVPWHWLAQGRVPDFFHFYFIDQHFLRYATMNQGRYQPAWFFIPIVLLGIFPWTGYLVQTLYQKAKEKNEVSRYLLLWTLVIFVFFSFSKSKLIPYIVPIFPPIALLLADYFHSHIRKGFRIGMGIQMVFTFILGIGLLYLPHLIPLPSTLIALPYLIAAGTMLMLTTLAGHYFFYKNQTNAGILTLSLFTIIAYGILSLATPGIDDRSIKSLALDIKSIAGPNDEVVAYAHYYQDLPFYLKQTVSIADWTNELNFGMHHGDVSKWIYDKDTFAKHWAGKNRVIALAKENDFVNFVQTHPHATIIVLKISHGNYLFTNKRNSG